MILNSLSGSSSIPISLCSTTVVWFHSFGGAMFPWGFVFPKASCFCIWRSCHQLQLLVTGFRKNDVYQSAQLETLGYASSAPLVPSKGGSLSTVCLLLIPQSQAGCLEPPVHVPLSSTLKFQGCTVQRVQLAADIHSYSRDLCRPL